MFAGNADLLLNEPEDLKKRFICEYHFKDENLLSKKLVCGAIPIPWENQINSKNNTQTYSANLSQAASTSQPTEVYDSCDSSCVDTDFIQRVTNFSTPTKKQADTPQKAKLKRQLFKTEAKLRKCRTTLKNLNSAKITSARELHHLPHFVRALVTMQLYHRNRTPWLPAEKAAALSLYYKSPGTYKFLRRKGFILPAPSTLSVA